MRAVLATAIVALAGYSAARPLLTTVGDISDAVGSETGGSPSSIRGSAGSAGSSAGSSAIGGSEDSDLISSLNGGSADVDFDGSGSGSEDINSGSGIGGSSQLDTPFGTLDEPSSAPGRGSTNFASGLGGQGLGDDADFNLNNLQSSSPLRGLSADDDGEALMPHGDGLSELSEEQLKDLVEYLTRMYGEIEDSESGLGAGADGSDLTTDSSAHTFDDENGLLAPVGSGKSGGSVDPFSLGAGGFGDEGFGDEGFGDEGFGDEGFGDEGFGDKDFAASESESASANSIFPNGRQLTSEEVAQLNSQIGGGAAASLPRQPAAVAQ